MIYIGSMFMDVIYNSLKQHVGQCGWMINNLVSKKGIFISLERRGLDRATSEMLTLAFVILCQMLLWWTKYSSYFINIHDIVI